MLFWVLLMSSLTYSFWVTGNVVHVLDGDTIDIMYNGKAQRIRLQHIDAPEKSQPFGQQARKFFSSLCSTKVVSVNVSGNDHYGRWLGDVYVLSLNVNKEMVRAGFAWWYRQYSHDASFGALEASSQQLKAGLWIQRNPDPPWTYRAVQRKFAKKFE